MTYDSTYSAINAVNSALGYEALKYDSTYDAALALLLNLGGEDKGYDSLYSIMVELARMAENGEIGGSSKLEIDLVETITENGQSVYMPEEGSVYKSVTIDVNVPTSGGENYSYKIGIADEAGLRAIGWDDESIGMYRDNNLQYTWRAGDFTVSDENKALYGVVTANTTMNTVEGMKYCPMINTSRSTLMSRFFYDCSSLTSIPLLDTSNATYMSYFFQDCTSLTSIPQLDTSRVTSMSYFFYGCRCLHSIPLLDTSNATSMSYLFYDCSSLTSIPQLDISRVTSMSNMFCNCSSLQSIPQLDTSSVTSMDSTFSGCSKLTTIPQLDTSSVTNMNNMFENCSSLQSIPQLDAGSVKTTNTPFNYYQLSNLVDIGGFDKLKASWTSYAFDKAPNATAESLMNIINGLWDWTDYPDGNAPLNDGTIYSFGTTHKLLMGSTNLAKLTEDEIAIATAKGWTLT